MEGRVKNRIKQLYEVAGGAEDQKFKFEDPWVLWRVGLKNRHWRLMEWLWRIKTIRNGGMDVLGRLKTTERGTMCASLGLSGLG